MKENVDGIVDIWTPSVEDCQKSQDYRAANEWMRKRTGTSGIRPTQLGIDAYRWGHQLPDKFFEGRTPPPVPIDSLENIEWYADQLHRCVYGFEYRNYRITGDHYWFLNFTPFLVADKDKHGNVTTEFSINYPYYSLMHDYLFKTIEEAHFQNKGFALMGGRGFGKTYVALSIMAKIYHLKPNSHGIVSASHSGHAGESFSKLKLMLDSIGEVHPTIALARLQDTKFLIESGQEVTRDGVKLKEGPKSKLQQVIYGDNSGVTRGSRPDIQLLEEIGDWSTGKGDLKSCIGASVGSWRVGSIWKSRVLMIGTGGSVASDQAKDVFTNADSYNLLAFKDFKPKSCFFMPSDYMMGGMGWEETAVNDNIRAKAWLEEERERTKDDMEIHTKLVQEYPLTIEEAFRKSGTNNFNQKNIARQWSVLFAGSEDRTVPKPERGFLDWVRTPDGRIKSVKWAKNPLGDFEILEHPFRGASGDEVFANLYVGGVDSIDMGNLDSTSDKNRSKLACLIKKRIVPGNFFSQTSNIYVAKYLGRSDDVRQDYEATLKLSMYYHAKMNVEYTRIGIVGYFRDSGKYHMLLKRPSIALPSGGETGNNAFLQQKRSNLIGTQATTPVIDHQDAKIQEYTNDYCDSIFFGDILEQLRDYQREDRKKYDLVIAMGLCELADEDMLGELASSETRDSAELELFGYYTDENGRKRWGVLPSASAEKQLLEQGPKDPVRWIDMSNRPRFDDNFHITGTETL
jgi:hypothetical protein